MNLFVKFIPVSINTQFCPERQTFKQQFWLHRDVEESAEVNKVKQTPG